MTEVNVELIDKILAAIETHPEQHDQSTWGSKNDCGTTLCTAGWAVVLSGHPHTWEGSMCSCDNCQGSLALQISEKDEDGMSDFTTVGARLLGIPESPVDAYDDPAYQDFIDGGGVDWACRLFHEADESDAKQILQGLRDGTIVPCPMTSKPDEN